jgi:Flp pilus assembly pilin Flp
MQIAHHRPTLIARRNRDGEAGASLVEYALLVALIAVVCITAVTFVGTSGSAKFNRTGSGIQGGPAPLPACNPATMHMHGDGTWHSNDVTDALVSCA